MSLTRALSRFARPPAPRRDDVCELCAAPFGAAHAHAVDLEARTLSCVCRPCALLFQDPHASRGKYRTVPDRILVDPELALDEAAWSALEIPVGLAFVFHNSVLGRWVAFYPSPAGPTESELSLERWSLVEGKSPLFGAVSPDVEAILVRSHRGRAELDAFLVPIDLCYELVGLVRQHWRGFDGGEARPLIDAFFDRVAARSRPIARGAA